MKKLAVYLNSHRTGTLEQDAGGQLQFTYNPEWLNNPDAIPLSRSLPLQEETFSGTKARPFFAGILPEQDSRIKIAAILGISDKNDFAMLEKIGGECAGAVCLLPEGAMPPESNDSSQRDLTELELSSIIDELPRRPLMAGTEGLRLSLAGAQDKIPLICVDRQYALALGNTPTTHILKPEPDRFPGLASNEVYCMRLAKRVGLSVPDTQFVQIGDKPGIIVERYDRLRDEHGMIRRIHQEDFCQALGYPPEKKYQAEGGPILRDCIALLREWSTTPVLDIRDFIDALIFNSIIGNADAHSKNFSILYNGAERRLTPFYDLVCTLVWEELSKTMSMKIGKCKYINALVSGHWKKMAGETSLGWPMIQDRMRGLAAATIDHTANTAEDMPELESSMTERIVEIITARAQEIKRMGET